MPQADAANPCMKTVAHWSALLDGELDERESATLWGHIQACPECRPFIDGQRRFNECIEKVLQAPQSGAMPRELRAKLVVLLEREAAGGFTAQAIAIRSDALHNAAQRRRVIAPFVPLLAAATVLTVVALAAVLTAPSRQPPPPKGAGGASAFSFDAAVTKLLPVQYTLLATHGFEDEAKLQEFAKRNGCTCDIRACCCGACEQYKMSPVFAQEGYIDGVPYQAVCYCRKKFEDGQGDDEPCRLATSRLKRMVFVMLKGKIPLAEGVAGDMVVRTDNACTVAAWHEGDATCFCMLRSGTSQDDARNYARTLVSAR